MIINEIILKNFGPHKYTKINLEHKEITAIVGHNGAGKSYLIEAVPACFFGTWASRGKLADGITLGHTGEAYLSVKFRIGATIYIAERKLKKTAKGVLQDAYLYKSQKGACAIAGPKVKDFEQEIRNIIGDPKVFFASSFASQANYGDIVECKPTERKKILAELLDLNKYQEKSDKFNSLSKDNQIKNKENNIKMETLKGMYKPDLPDSKETIEAKIKQLKREEAQLREDKANAVNQFTEANTNLIKLEEQSRKQEDLIKEGETLTLKKEQIKSQITHHKKGAKSLLGLEAQQKQRENIIATNQKRTKENVGIQKTKDEARALISRYERDKAQHDLLKKQASILSGGDFTHRQCQSCQFLSTAHLAKKKLGAIQLPRQDQVMEWARASALCLIDLHDVPRDVSQSLGEAKLAQESIGHLSRSLEDVEREKRRCEKELNKCPSTDFKDLKEEVSNFRHKMSQQDAHIEKVQNQINLYTKTIEQILEIKSHNNQIAQRLSQLNIQLESQSMNEKTYTYLTDAFGRKGIQALLIDSSIPQLQSISEELLRLATNGRMQIDFSTQKELKSGDISESLEILCTDEKGTRDISHFSGGEQKMLRTIIRLTLAIFQSQKSNMKLQTLIIDEVFDTLDSENANNLLRVLEKVRSFFMKIVFVSHNEEMLVDFPDKIILEKKQNVTWEKKQNVTCVC